MLPEDKKAIPTKVFQTQQRFGMLFARGPPGDLQSYTVVIGRTMAQVQPLWRNTPGCIMAALRDTCAMSLTECRFDEFSRIAAVDRHPSNLCVERRINRRTQRRFDNWKSILFKCEQHMLQSAR
eukprot:4583771-Pyramimonas_sp.AAC.1